MKPARLIWIAALAALALAGCSLAGDIPPPDDYRPPATQVAAVETNFPLMPPDPERGKVIYDRSCAPCHGETGLGDGVQSGDLPVQVPLLANANTAVNAAPVDWFNMVTYGNIDRFMPPFGGSLTDRQRWDVVAYVFTLSMQPNQLAVGEDVFAAQCQDCHGENGRGDGVLAVSQDIQMGSWGDTERLATLSNQQLLDMIALGVPGTQMPAFEDRLASDQLWAVTQYVRSLAFAQTEQESAAVSEQGAAASELAQPALPGVETASVRVNVVNGSGEAVPDRLQVTLTGYDNMQAAVNLDGELEGESYLFEEVEKLPQRVYLASVEYQDMVFYSDILRLEETPAEGEAQVSVTIYETSSDTSQLTAERVHIFLEFPEPGRLQVAQLFLITNPTGRVIVPPQEGAPVLQFELPQDAVALQFADSVLGERYIETPGGFGDTASIAPGQSQHQVLYVYELLYDRKHTLELKMPLDVRSAVVALPDLTGLKLASPQLREAGQRQVEGASLHLYSASDLPAGSTLEMTISGRPGSGPLFSSGPVANLVLGGGMLLVVLIVGLLWVRQLRQQNRPAAAAQQPVDEPESVETLLDAILALDDLYRAGDLPVEAYQKRRAVLKERLRNARLKQDRQEA